MTTLFIDSGGSATNSGTTDDNTAPLSGTSNATIVANATFTDGNVNTGTDQITVTAHGYTAGTGVQLTSSGTLPAGLVTGTYYFIGVVDANTITLHLTIADAIAGTNIVNITAAAGGGTHTINNRTVNLGGSPDLSTIRCNLFRVTTTSTSNVLTTVGGPHGMTTGDAFMCSIVSGGTAPTGLAIGAGNVGYAEVLTTTTIRWHLSRAAALAGTPDANITAAEVRSMQLRSLPPMDLTADANEDAIYLNSATNSNRKTFWIRAVSDTNDLVVLDDTPTGLGAGSSWAIGGRILSTDATALTNAVNCMRNGDQLYLNNDVALSINLTPRSVTGEFQNTNGAYRYVIGKPGARRLLANTGNGDLWSNTNAQVNTIFYNLEMQSQGTGGIIAQLGDVYTHAWECRFTDSGANALQSGGGLILPDHFFRCEFSGMTAAVIATVAHISLVYECYIHDCADSAAQRGYPCFNSCIIERCGGAGYNGNSFSSWSVFYNSTIYRNNWNGFSGQGFISHVAPHFVGNIFKDNGDLSTEGNIERDTGHYPIYSRDNCYSNAGGRGGSNTVGFTVHSSDITSDPLFVAPDGALSISGTDTTNDQVTVTGHGVTTGQMCTVSATGGGLTGGHTFYYLRAVDANTLQFHSTLTGAQNNTGKVDLTGAISATIMLGTARNFGLQSGSPAKGIAYTFPGSGTTSYRDMGAAQRQESASGGGLLVNPGMRGGMV